jgi:hypothetical protein
MSSCAGGRLTSTSRRRRWTGDSCARRSATLSGKASQRRRWKTSLGGSHGKNFRAADPAVGCVVSRALSRRAVFSGRCRVWPAVVPWDSEESSDSDDWCRPLVLFNELVGGGAADTEQPSGGGQVQDRRQLFGERGGRHRLRPSVRLLACNQVHHTAEERLPKPRLRGVLQPSPWVLVSTLVQWRQLTLCRPPWTD